MTRRRPIDLHRRVSCPENGRIPRVGREHVADNCRLAPQHDLLRREPHIRRPEDNRRQHECQERGADDDRLTRAIALGLPEKTTANPRGAD